MNVDLIYQFQRDDAFAAQFSAEAYQTFVAMPFSNRGGYPEPRIKDLLLTKVHDKANELLSKACNRRTFAPLTRVDAGASGAVVITDQIVTQILGCHFFLGDITGCNFGVVLETGVALALKPNGRVLLFTQDDTASLHFDLKVTKTNSYTEENLVGQAAHALVGAAEVFEKEADRYIRLVSSRLTPDAIILLNLYGKLWKGWCDGKPLPSIFYHVVKDCFPFDQDAGRVAFHDGVRELLDARLFWTEYRSNVNPNTDQFGMHATKLGWRVIEHIWQHDEQMRQPTGAPTGPFPHQASQAHVS